MEYAYLNVFVNALSAMFEFIFHDVLSPILTEILQLFVNFFTNVIWVLLSKLILGLFIAVCSLVDFVESIFNVFAGLSPVLYVNPETNKPKTMSLIDILFEMEAITQAFWVITLFSLGLCIIFTIFQTVKSISDMALEDKNPISKVLTDAMKAGITFFLIPFLCVMMLQLSTVVTKQADAAFNAANGGDTSIGTIIFLSASLEADKKIYEPKSVTTGEIALVNPNSTPPVPSFNDSVRGPYMNYLDSSGRPTTGGKDYRNQDTVLNDFHAENFSYIVGFLSAILVLLILLISIITFVRRLFELLLLYIVSPFFVSTIPLDDGATFARWREMFIAKFFSGFGIIFSMKFYLMIVPFLADSRLELYPKTAPNGFVINTVLQLFLIIGGAWAVFKSQSLIMELLNPNAAEAEKQASALLTGAVTGAAMGAVTVATGGTSAALTGAMGAVGAVGGAASSGVQSSSGSSNGSSSASKQQQSSQDENQAYRG